MVKSRLSVGAVTKVVENENKNTDMKIFWGMSVNTIVLYVLVSG